MHTHANNTLTCYLFNQIIKNKCVICSDRTRKL